MILGIIDFIETALILLCRKKHISILCVWSNHKIFLNIFTGRIKVMKYNGFAYRQVKNGPIIFSFVVTSSEIDGWAKVPTKLTTQPRNFQRAENQNHVKDIRFF